MPSTADAVALAQIVGDLSTLLVRDVVELFRRYGSDPDFAAILLAAFPGVVGPYLQASALTSAQMYDEMAPALAFKATPVPELPADRLAGSVKWSLFAPGGATPVERLSGAAQRMVFDVSRQTMLTNLAVEYDVPIEEVSSPGTRWARHASANACGFCRVMATRGAVYRSSARAAKKAGKQVGGKKTGSLRGQRKYSDKFHDNCHCIAVPVRPGDSYEPPAYVEQWEQDYIDAVKAAQAAGRTKGEYGAIDLKAVVAEMDKAAK